MVLSAIPEPDPRRRKKHIALTGDVPSPVNPPSGCHFHTRCALKERRCEESYPAMPGLGDGHRAACHLAGGATFPGAAP